MKYNRRRQNESSSNEAKSPDVDEVPIGAAIFDKDDNLICANHNRRELDQNPTSHAEILVLEEASKS